ncbi:DUF3817 domain-containing protein [Tsukamurella pseudospumae]|uniref:DUF3817 domain-containing protein n=1 Tax=Tsukamurella pseudospumae TaxID=239498 RepID=A0A138AN37_9ACTN|nr:DUF3817 domain-containing protein [Tsukamurella pseudospumae]KXO97776.1 hypothetical protein AXK61_21395 [Tsukamurella pseudospumae]KXP11876.1 hypothetical protein AXK60_24450 [Tsukamurella pseudospumae]
MTEAPVTSAEKLAAKRRDQVGSALKRYRFMATLTGVVLLIFCAEMIYKYLLAKAFGWESPAWLFYFGAVHGWCYFIYLLVTLDLGSKVRWPAKRFLLTLLAGTIPFASFYFEKKNSDEIRATFDL